jgi:hypothetical protein
MHDLPENYLRSPKIALPMRTMLLPSSTANV